MSKKIFIIFSMILLWIPDISLGKDIRFELERPVIPVLVKKQINPTVKATLIQIKQAVLTLSGRLMSTCKKVPTCLISFLLRYMELIKTG